MSAEKRTRMYLTSAVMGFVATLLMIGAHLLDWPDFIKGATIGLLLVSLVMLLLRRLRDEYIQQLWNSGTSLAFVAVVVVFVFSPFLEGVMDGFTQAVHRQDISAAFIGPVALLAFFVGFHLKWLRTSL